jgi:hypothetical protein
MGPEADLVEIADRINKKLTYPDIADKQKIKIFTTQHDPQAIEQLYQRVNECNDYYQTLTL